MLVRIGLSAERMVEELLVFDRRGYKKVPSVDSQRVSIILSWKVWGRMEDAI